MSQPYRTATLVTSPHLLRHSPPRHNPAGEVTRAHPATRRPATQAFEFKARRDEEVNSHSRPRSNQALGLKALRPERRHLPFLGEADPINSTKLCRGGCWVAGCAHSLPHQLLPRRPRSPHHSSPRRSKYSPALRPHGPGSAAPPPGLNSWHFICGILCCAGGDSLIVSDGQPPPGQYPPGRRHPREADRRKAEGRTAAGISAMSAMTTARGKTDTLRRDRGKLPPPRGKSLSG